ncbi:MAG: hypothetical protein ACUVQH_07955 [Thermogutta sp.]
MAPAFDPYHVWLGIPPHEQPPDYYRLLGIARFEEDLDVIDQAAERQLEFLREQLKTPHRDLAEQLQREIHAARQVLLDPNKKRAYDLALRQRLFPEGAATKRESASVQVADGTLHAAVLRILQTAASPLLFLWKRPMLVTLVATVLLLTAALFVVLSPPPGGTEGGPLEVASAGSNSQSLVVQAPAEGPPQEPQSRPRQEVQSADGQTQPGSTASSKLPSTTQAAPAGTEASVSSAAEVANLPPLAPGLIGRISVNGEDLGVIVRYLPGEVFSQDAINRLIHQYGLLPGDQRVVLSGVIRVQCPTNQSSVPVFVRGTTESGYLNTISITIDGRPLPFPADFQQTTFGFGLFLTCGDHPITCQLQGKALGNGFRLEIGAVRGVEGSPPGPSGSVQQELVKVGYTLEDLTKANELPTLGRHALNTEIKSLSVEELEPGRLAERGTPQSEPAPPATVAMTPGRQPVPPHADLLRAREEIRAKYRKDLQEATAPAARALLAKTLLKEGNSETDPPRQYMLYEEARELAIAAGDPDLAIQAGEAIGLAFEVDSWPMHVSAMNQLAKGARTPQTRENVLGILTPLCDSAISEDRYDVADSLLDLASNLASQLRDPVRREQFSRRRDEVKSITTAFAAIQDSLEVLQQNPDDPQANEAVGRFYCFVKHEWKKGLPYLAKAETILLRTVAQAELNHQVGTASQLQLADDWWAIGETLAGPEKSAVRRHAGYWYLQCASRLSGEAAQRANARLAESGRIIDLLALAASRRVTAIGNWQIGSKYLVSPPEPSAQIIFSVVPPAEYDLVVEIQAVPLPPPPRGQASGSQRSDPSLEIGRGAFAVGLIQGRRQFLAVTNFQIPNQGSFSFLADYDKKGPDPANPTFCPAAVVRNQRPSTIVYSVKKTGVTVTGNEGPFIQYNGDYSQLSMPQGWNAANQPRLFFATRLAVYRITRAELQDIGE